MSECTWIAPSRAEQEVTLRKTVADNRDTRRSACNKLIKIIKSVILLCLLAKVCHSTKLALSVDRFTVIRNNPSSSSSTVNSSEQSSLVVDCQIALQSWSTPNQCIRKTTERCAMNCNTTLNSSTCPVPLNLSDGLDHCVNVLLLVHVGRPKHRELWHSRVLCSDGVRDVA